MALLDSYEPQGFADRGGLLGRLLSLRPDLASDEQNDDQPGSTPQAPLWLSSGTRPNKLSNAGGPSMGSTIHPAQYAQAAIGTLSPDPFYVPLRDVPTGDPLAVAGQPPSPGPLVVRGAALLGLAAAASLASRKSRELLGGPPRPLAPVFPEPPVVP